MFQKRIVDAQKILALSLIFFTNSTLSIYAQEPGNVSPSEESIEEKKPLNLPLERESPPNEKDQIQFNIPDLTEFGRPTDERQVSGASRGGDSRNIQENLTALFPQATPLFGLTIESYPTFWVYIPYEGNNSQAYQFTILSDKNEQIYQTKILNFTGELPGISKFKLPSNARPLEAEKTYSWYLFVYSQPSELIPATVIRGTVRRITPTQKLETQLKAATNDRHRAQILGKFGIWYDLLTLLGTKSSLRRDWVNLLRDRDVGLSNLSLKPIVDCCSTSQELRRTGNRE